MVLYLPIDNLPHPVYLADDNTKRLNGMIITERHTILVHIFRCHKRKTIFADIWNLSIELIELEKTASFVCNSYHFLFYTKALSDQFF